jgi:hypothetical protein
MIRRALVLAGIASTLVVVSGAGAQTPAPRTAAPGAPGRAPAKKRLAVPKNVKN